MREYNRLDNKYSLYIITLIIIIILDKEGRSNWPLGYNGKFPVGTHSPSRSVPGPKLLVLLLMRPGTLAFHSNLLLPEPVFLLA